MARKKLRVTQVRDGKRVTFLTPNKGKPGKTPKDKQWYEPSGVETGWKKDMPEEERRRLVLKAHKGDDLSSARSMQAKVNVTTDKETKQRARADAQYFFRRHRIGKGAVTPEVTEAPDIIDVLKQEYLKKKDDISVLKERIAAIKRSTRDRRDLSLSLQQRERELEQIEGRLIGKRVDIKTIKATPKAPVTPKPKRDKGAVVSLQRLHARRSTQARIRDEQQTHQVTIEVDSPRVKVWLKDPSAADIKGIDTPRARRSKSPRITPKTPKLRR